jgi:hypothetical protein
MNHTTNLAIAATAVALAVLMVAAIPLVSMQALAHHHYHHHYHHRDLANNNLSTHRVVIGSTETTAVQAADNSQHCAIGAGATVATCSNTPINNQTQTTNSGSTGAG